MAVARGIEAVEGDLVFTGGKLMIFVFVTAIFCIFYGVIV